MKTFLKRFVLVLSLSFNVAILASETVPITIEAIKVLKEVFKSRMTP